jgi:hypothetical protein
LKEKYIMSYLVQNVSGAVASGPKVIGHIASTPPLQNWAIGQIDWVDDMFYSFYADNSTVFTILAGPSVPPIVASGPIAKYSANTATTAATLSAASISGSSEVLVNMTGTLTAGAALTLPTVAQLVAAAPTLVSGATYKLRILNTGAGAFAWTVTTATGWTLTGTMTVAQNTYRDFLVTMTSATTATLQSLGQVGVTAV